MENKERSSREDLDSHWQRRQWLAAGLASVALPSGLFAEVHSSDAVPSPTSSPKQLTAELSSMNNKISLCLNTSTVRGHKLSVPQQIDLAADAGYDAIELWMGDLKEFTNSGGKLADLRKQLGDRGLVVPSAIGFGKWIVDDDGERAKGLEECKRDMGILAEIGGLRIAAPPSGATEKSGLSLIAAADRYGKLLDLGRQMGVVPQLELWGHSKNLSRLGEVAFVAAECGHADACVLPDVYHIYKGGSGFDGLQMLNPKRIYCFHINDYPETPPRETIKDADRIYPGDGIAPMQRIFQPLFEGGFAGALSLELFNPEYYKQDAKLVAKTGIEKIRAVIDLVKRSA